ncbi:hydantoinase B/oxoprolinase family protein [Pigmentiphaga soli]|uniref:Hydantoinase B/oxoprolinase family protein n=1 Tax=Pigmentiphaga soli TaxID=1007095 RepID=A0ABP8GKG6_9BURK
MNTPPLSRPTKIDPIRRELLKNALVTIADNALVMVVRTARSANVKNSMDFSAAICDGEGRLVGQGMSVPVHLGAMMPALRGCLDYFGDDIQPGDVLASNDPYSGCSHLNDIFTFKPIYADGVRVGFIGLILHHTDLGGRVPGGNAADSNEIFEEGLRIPPSKLVERGTPNTTLMRVIEFNSRVPQRVLGDLAAQLAALNQAERDMNKLLESWTADSYQAYTDDLIDYGEELTRASIRKLPDGEVEFVEWNDDDGVHEGPCKIHVRLTKRDDEIICDFSGSPPQSGGAVHCNYAFTASCAYAAIRTLLDEAVPTNAGMYRPITVIAPEGTIVSAKFPAALGSRGQIGYRIRSIMLGVLAELTRDRMPAGPGGSEFGIAAAGLDQEGKRFLHLEFHNNTGNGGGPVHDGQDAGPNCIGNIANVPVELVEADNPIRIEEYAFLPDTGGAGRLRGALGVVRQYRFLVPDVLVQVRSDRFKTRAWGFKGGEGGAHARAFLNPGTPHCEALPSKFIRVFGAGDVFRAEMAGSGGYGRAVEREPERVLQDVLQGKVTSEHARSAYRVVITEQLQVDEAATRALRAG